MSLANKLKIFPVKSGTWDKSRGKFVEFSGAGWFGLSWLVVFLKAVHHTGIFIAGISHESRERTHVIVDVFWLIFYWDVTFIQLHMLRTRREKAQCFNIIFNYFLKSGEQLIFYWSLEILM